MNWINVLIVFQREVLDQLRDRRTLFMVAVLPLLLYPILGIGMVQMMLLFSEQPRTVVVLGTAELPPSGPLLLEDGHFVRDLFRTADDADKLAVVDDQPPIKDSDSDRATLLKTARTLADRLLKLRTHELPELRKQGTLPPEIREQHLNDALGASGMQVLVVFPPGFQQHLEQRRRQLENRELTSDEFPRPLVVYNSADEKSQIAYTRVSDALRSWEKRVLRSELKAGGLPENLPSPVDADVLDLADQVQLSANVWSKLFPALLVIMALTGAFYPAIDVVAGEKERGTMETLLISPASRTEIVLGKFLTVLLFSISTAVLNLLSLGGTGKYMVSLAGTGRGVASRLGDLSLPPVSSIAWVLVMLLPLAALFSALCLALATFARSNKEGQYYLTPVLMVTMGLTVFCLSPGVELEPFYSVMPVMGPSLLLKELLRSSGNIGELSLFAIPVLISSVGYAALALWWAIDQFGREDVLFREAERFDLRLWIVHLFRDKELTPSFAEGMFCFIAIMLLQFAAMKFMQAPLQGVTAASRSTAMMQLLMIQQLVIIATPALMMGVMLTSSIRATFRLRWPRSIELAAALALPVVLHPVVLTLAGLIQGFFPPLPPAVVEALGSMTDDSQPLWLVLLAFAGAPALCEEIAFRGFILSGFCRGGRIYIAMVFSSLAFGVMHLIPQQVFNASLLGLVLGLMCIRSRSLVPGIAFHFVFNGLEVVRNRYGAQLPAGGGWDYVWKVEEGSLVYQPLLVLTCLAAGTALIVWWWRQPSPGKIPVRGERLASRE
ncbi:ABC transporter permease subunit/CPBP intramembrane protease [Planctellipticum variicoloris]|uniref:ABC transporter permease subunit/CPBP intramembrane protease n=1 Tax=Planctellipticum variicoloris TaxID=3064265 RepID=UPI003013C62F|nr:ABC transporter permease subunit [Planctomycetaceae bacterium SH412]